MFRKQWLQKKITVAEAEAAHLVTDDRLGPDPVPFGFQNKRWRTLLSLMRAGDELWEFSTEPESFEHNAGRQGIALVRRGRLIGCMMSVIN